jgi:putative ABC transport system permease protein
MFLSYLKIAFRNLLKKKIFTIINVLGLSVGATASLIIFLYVQSEMSFDQFLPDSERLYRMAEDRIYPDRVAHFAMIPGGFAAAVKDDVPEVEASTRLVGFPQFATVVRYKDNIFSEHYFFSADSNFFEVIPFKLLKGNPKQVLSHHNSIVLTTSAAAKYFGTEDPIGKRMEIFGQNIEVTGVMEDVPANSHMRFDALTSTLDVGFLRGEPNYYVAGAFTYLRLAPGTDPKNVESKFPGLVEKYAAGQIEREMGVSYKKYVADGNGYRYFLQPLHDIHLQSQLQHEIKSNGNNTTVKALMFIGFLILAIAGINFVNLATARSSERGREVGVRKVLGSKKRQLISQFLSESMLISVISIALALVILQALLGYFNSISETKLQLNFIQNPWIIVALITITLGLGLLAGLYPAFYISALKPVSILKGKFQGSSRGTALRNGLVVFQFTVSIILISATLIVNDQVNFMQSKPLGFEKENLLVINHNSNRKESFALQQQLRTIKGVQSVASSNSVPGGYFFGLPFKVQGSEEIFTPKGMTADDNFSETIKYKILDGRAFSDEFDDSLSIIINQRAAKALRLENPVGSTLYNNVNPQTPIPYKIIGVVEDFNFESLHNDIAPLVIMSTEGQQSFQSMLIVRLDEGDYNATLTGIQSKWKEILPNEPFIYSFMDSKLDNLYVTEGNSSKLLVTFTFIAIVVACVGLFGLAAYTAGQRTKEIGVRKVLGASSAGIVGLLSKDFFKLVIAAIVIGSPLAWYLVREWQSSFAYRVPLSVVTFMNAALIVLIFTGITISYQAITASLVNPAKSLKEE